MRSIRSSVNLEWEDCNLSAIGPLQPLAFQICVTVLGRYLPLAAKFSVSGVCRLLTPTSDSQASALERFITIWRMAQA